MTRLMTKHDFDEIVIGEFKAFPFSQLFLLSNEQVSDCVSQWLRLKSDSDYRTYIHAALTLPKEKLINNRKYCFMVARDMLDELIVCLAESFYYDEIPYSCWTVDIGQPFTKGPVKDRLDSVSIRDFFTDIFDVMYDRIYENELSTLTYLHLLTNDKKYLRGEI